MTEIASLIYTHNRTDDAKINMEIIRHEWPKAGIGNTAIIHAFNGNQEWWPQPYLEDHLIRQPNPGHFLGAAALIDAGMQTVQEHVPDAAYTVILAADTWLIKPDYLRGVLQTMQNDHLRIATCAWGNPKKLGESGFALDCWIVDNKWAAKWGMFPLDYAGFEKQFGVYELYRRGLPVFLENLTLARFFDASFKEDATGISRELLAEQKMYRFTPREPVHHMGGDGIVRRPGYVLAMGLVGHHSPEPKQTILRAAGITGGEATQQLLRSKDLVYYNRGLRDRYPFQVLDNIE